MILLSQSISDWRLWYISSSERTLSSVASNGSRCSSRSASNYVSKTTQSYRVQLLIIVTVILQRAVDHVQLVQLRKGENRLAQQQLVASCEVASKKSLLFSLNILDNLLRSLRNRSLHRLLQRGEERLDAFRVLERQFRDVREEGAVGGRNCLQIELGNPGID